MSWSYSGDPGSSPRDALRFLLGDTNPDAPLFSNEELDYLLVLAGGQVLAAAILACLQLATRYSSEVDFAVEAELRVDLSQKAKAWAERARDLSGGTPLPPSATRRHPLPYGGGISVADMAQQEADGDRVPPTFTVGMLDDRGAGTPDGEGA